MARRSFRHRAETFGLDTSSPWALPAFRLLFSVPRAYQPLVEAWDARFPGTRRSLDRLVDMGFVSFQPAVIVDTRTGRPADRLGSPMARYRATARGRRLARAAALDLRVLSDEFARLTPQQAPRLAALLSAFDLDPAQGKVGASVPWAAQASGLPSRSARWWVQHLVDRGLLARLPQRHPDRRAAVPAHWRVTRLLCRQVLDLLEAFPDTAPASLRVEFRLSRTRFLDDVDPARVGIGGATDFDHDVETQEVLAALFASSRAVPDGVFAVEPRLSLPVAQDRVPWQFRSGAPGSVFYQPDAEIRELGGPAGVPARSVVEYERFQTRRDGWAHIERFLGWVHLTALPFEPAVLRFVVNSPARVRSYVELIEAFADYALDHPGRMPASPVTLAVSSSQRLVAAADALDPREWFRISLAAGTVDGSRAPVMHDPDSSPYDDYFSRPAGGAA